MRLKIKVDGVTLGPGKVDLLSAIDEEGSITRAARKVGLSYRRSWALLETLQDMTPRPLFETQTGGSDGGGSRLTDFGRLVVNRYREAEQAAIKACEPLIDGLQPQPPQRPD